MLNQIILLIFLLLLSGFFSSSETAFFSISRTKARHLTKTNEKAYRLIHELKQDPHRLLTTILIGNNLVNVGASALATSLSIDIFSSYAIGLATGIMTFLILVFGEVLPKSVATRNNLLIARMTVYPIYWLSKLFLPVLIFLNFIPKLTGKIKKTPSATEEELLTFVEVVEEEGEIDEHEKELIENVFEFDDTSASEIMTPRGDMFAIEADQSIQFEKVVKSGYTRIPVFQTDTDHIVGILNIKDLFLHQATASGQPPDIRKIMREPYFVPENKKLDRLLQQFKKRKIHMAIVVDEHGGVSGLITLEDALEELVGEITDETDKDEQRIVHINPAEWRILGKTDIEEVNETTGLEIPDLKEYDTLSGFFLDRVGRIPKEKEQISSGEFTITVNKMDGIRILEFIVRKNPPTEDAPQVDLPTES